MKRVAFLILLVGSLMLATRATEVRAASSCSSVGKNPVLPDLTKVKADIISLIHSSQPEWPADVFNGQPNYGPFFVRQAWHCSGSYRRFDGRGGCDGGRQRFNPELSWDDNTNLDKAKTLLWPIKHKYGAGLSWGDLIILAGTTAIEDMGGPVLGFCAGRIDDMNGKASDLLGPTHEQKEDEPCAVNGDCQPPFGTTTIGLIYVNPEGPMGNPDPLGSAPQVRDTFNRMGMNDTETVALIGGGHAFGKTHGACPLGAGPSPKEDPSNPWPGLCGSGPQNVYTSGFEGPWTFTPTNWSNFYFRHLLAFDWNLTQSPGEKYQWYNASLPGLMMLTSDVSLKFDPSYAALVKTYANDIGVLETQFAHAWYKLTTRDMGPATRCLGPWVPPPQPFQNPLPPPPSQLPDFTKVRQQLLPLIFPSQPNPPSCLPADMLPDGSLYNGAIFISLAYQCAATFRQTDYLGGCNGARIRFPPESQWPVNAGITEALQLLQPLQAAFAPALSWADLIVFAAQVALEQAVPSTSTFQLTFCPGRTDATNGDGSEYLAPLLNGAANWTDIKQRWDIMGFTQEEMVALSGRPRSPSLQAALGYQGSWTTNPSLLSNLYFNNLLDLTWIQDPSLQSQYLANATSPQLFLTQSDLQLYWEADPKAIAQEYASDNDFFLSNFASAWTKLMNIDRFNGPVENICDSSAQLKIR